MRGFVEAGFHKTGLSFQVLIVEGNRTNARDQQRSAPMTVKRDEADELLVSGHLIEVPIEFVPSDADTHQYVLGYVSKPTWDRMTLMPRKITQHGKLPEGHAVFMPRAEDVPQLARDIGEQLFRCAAQAVKHRDWNELLELGHDLACIFPPNMGGTKVLRESAIGRYRTLLYESLAKREMTPRDTQPFHRHFDRIVKPEVFSAHGLGDAMGKDHRRMWYRLNTKLQNGEEPDFGAYYDKQHPKA